MSKININEIAKLTIAELAKQGSVLSPQNYEQMYESIAAKMGYSSGRSERINAYLNRLNESLKSQAIKAAPNSEAELISFLISRVNANTQPPEANNALLLIKALLKLLARSKVAQISQLAILSQEKLLKTPGAINAVKNDWLDELANLCAILEGDQGANKDLELANRLAAVFANALRPSIASDEQTQIQSVKKELAARPKLVCEESFAPLANRLIEQRIELDRAEISSSHKMLDELLVKIGVKIAAILSMASSGEEKISQIRKEIASIEIENQTVENLKEHLLIIVENLEKELGSLKDDMSEEGSNIGKLQVKVSGLQAEINKLKEESQQDFLTQLSNKRHIQSQLEAAEDGFMLYNINYSLIFFDIDHFKNINDSYGHTAGDAILAGIGSIILQNCRKLDCAGRYGGEEFMLILPHTDLDHAYKIAQNIKEQVQTHKFIYKDKQIIVQLSGGVAERVQSSSAAALIERADKLLYAAKEGGRNQIKR